MKILATSANSVSHWLTFSGKTTSSRLPKPSKCLTVPNCVTLGKDELQELARETVEALPFQAKVPAIQQLTRRAILFLSGLKQAQKAPKQSHSGLPDIHKKHLLLPSAPTLTALLWPIPNKVGSAAQSTHPIPQISPIMLDKVLPYLKWHRQFPGLAQERPGVLLFDTSTLGRKPWPFLSTASRGGIGWEDIALRDVVTSLESAWRPGQARDTELVLSENPKTRQAFVMSQLGVKTLPYSESTLQNAIYALAHMGIITAAPGYNQGFIVRKRPLLSLRDELLSVPAQKRSMQALVTAYYGQETDPKKHDHACQFLCRTVIDKAKRANRHLYPLFTEQFGYDLAQKGLKDTQRTLTTDIHGLANALGKTWDNTRQQMAQITKRRLRGKRVLPGGVTLSWKRENPSHRNSRILYTLTRNRI